MPRTQSRSLRHGHALQAARCLLCGSDDLALALPLARVGGRQRLPPRPPAQESSPSTCICAARAATCRSRMWSTPTSCSGNYTYATTSSLGLVEHFRKYADGDGRKAAAPRRFARRGHRQQRRLAAQGVPRTRLSRGRAWTRPSRSRPARRADGVADACRNTSRRSGAADSRRARPRRARHREQRLRPFGPAAGDGRRRFANCSPRMACSPSRCRTCSTSCRRCSSTPFTTNTSAITRCGRLRAFFARHGLELIDVAAHPDEGRVAARHGATRGRAAAGLARGAAADRMGESHAAAQPGDVPRPRSPRSTPRRNQFVALLDRCRAAGQDRRRLRRIADRDDAACTSSISASDIDFLVDDNPVQAAHGAAPGIKSRSIRPRRFTNAKRTWWRSWRGTTRRPSWRNTGGSRSPAGGSSSRCRNCR